MKYFKQAIFSFCLVFCFDVNAVVKIENLHDYNFGMIRPAEQPVKASSLRILFSHYTVTLRGQHDQSQTFHLANGMDLVPYKIVWKDVLGNSAHLVPGVASPTFRGSNESNSGIQSNTSILSMQIQGMAPRPGHYADTLTLVITPG